MYGRVLHCSAYWSTVALNEVQYSTYRSLYLIVQYKPMSSATVLQRRTYSNIDNNIEDQEVGEYEGGNRRDASTASSEVKWGITWSFNDNSRALGRRGPLRALERKAQNSRRRGGIRQNPRNYGRNPKGAKSNASPRSTQNTKENYEENSH